MRGDTHGGWRLLSTTQSGQLYWWRVYKRRSINKILKQNIQVGLALARRVAQKAHKTVRAVKDFAPLHSSCVARI